MSFIRSSLFSLALTLLIGGFSVAEEPYSAGEFFDHLSSIYDQHEKQAGDYLLSEIDLFTQLYPQSDLIPRAYHLKALVYLEQGDEPRALVELLRVLHLYPESDIVSAATGNIKTMIETEKDIRERRSQLETLLASPVAGSRAERHHLFIEYLHNLGIDDLRRHFVWAGQEFIASFPDHESVPEVHRWIVEAYELDGKEDAANAGYQKYLALYADSKSAGTMKVKWAEHLYLRVKDHLRALEVLEQVLNDYAGQNAAGEALYHRAKIRYSESKEYTLAITDARKLVTDFPQHPRVFDALKFIAETNAKRLKQYQIAIDTYDEIAQLFPGDARVFATMKEAADLCETKLGYFLKASERFAALAEAYPDHEGAVEALEGAAGILEKRVNDCPGALEAYQKLIAKYPNSKEADTARKRVEKLQKKVADGKC